jgi:hypothetical protein
LHISVGGYGLVCGGVENVGGLVLEIPLETINGFISDE